MNFYSDDQFCAALAASYFPGRSVQQSLYHIQGKILRIPTVDGIRPLTRFPLASAFVDFYEPLLDSSASPHSVRHIPRVSHGLVSAERWHDEAMNQAYEPAPTVKWNTVNGWSDYQTARKKTFSDINRRRRKLERELGTLRFTFNDSDPEVLRSCMALKSRQYQTSGEIDAFASPEHTKFFQALAQCGLLLVSSLRVGDRLIAASICATHQQHLYYWIPAYSAKFRQYSPGLLLLASLLQESCKRGDKEFDFLIGNESYKWNFATHTRIIAEIGQPALAQQAFRSFQKTAKPIIFDLINKSPRLKSRLKMMTQRLSS